MDPIIADHPTTIPPVAPPVRRVMVLTLLGVALALFYRKPDALLHAQFWAEDGTIFFRDNYFHGLGAVFIPYSGYYHFALRLVAWVAGFLPVLVQPAVYAWVTLGLTLAVAAKLFSSRVHLPNKPLLAFALVLVPRGNGEILLTVTAVQWFLSVLLVLILIQDDARTPVEALGDMALLVVVGLSGPYSILYLPLFALRLVFVSRRSGNVLCTGIIAACAAIQLSAVLRFPGGPNEHPPLSQWIEVFVRRPVGSLMLGTRLAENYLTHVTAVLLLTGLLALLGTLVGRQRGFLWTTTVLLGAAAAAYASTLFRFLKAADILFVGFDSADRYFFLPKLFFIWLLLIFLPGDRSPGWRGVTAGVLFLAGMAAAADFACPAYGEMNWAQQVRQFDHGDTKSIKINPDWKIDLDTHSSLRGAVNPAPMSPAPDPVVYQDILLAKPVAIRSVNPLQRVTVDGDDFLQVHPVGEVVFDIPPGSQDVGAEFAIRPEAWQPPRHAAGVEFRADYVPQIGGAPVTLWERVLRPSEVTADRGTQTMHVTLPPDAAGQIVLHTLAPPGATDLSNAWACWARVRFNAPPAKP